MKITEGRAYERVKFTHLINYDSSGDWLAMYGADVPFKHGDVFKIRRRDFKRSMLRWLSLNVLGVNNGPNFRN